MLSQASPKHPFFFISTQCLIIVSILSFTLPVGTVCQHSGLEPKVIRTHRRLHFCSCHPRKELEHKYKLLIRLSQLISAFICPSKSTCKYFPHVHYRSNHIVHFNCPPRLLLLMAPQFPSTLGFTESKSSSLSIKCCQF